jgi:hypothetical protein
LATDIEALEKFHVLDHPIGAEWYKDPSVFGQMWRSGARQK